MRTRFLPVAHAMLAAIVFSAPAFAGPLDTVQGTLGNTLGTQQKDGQDADSGTAASATIGTNTIDGMLNRQPAPATPASRPAEPASPSYTQEAAPPCDPADYPGPCQTPNASLNAALSGRLLQRVYFLRNSSTLDESSKADLVDFARLYSRRIGDLVVVGSEEKTPGSMTVTNQLGLERALAVETVLKQNGIVAGRLRVTETPASDGIAGDYVDIRLDGY